MVQTGPGLRYGRGVGQHAHAALNLGQIASWNSSGRLVVDAHLEASGAPVHELDGALGLDVGNGRVDVLGNYVPSVQQATGHVFAVARVALHHLIVGFEAGAGDLAHAQSLVVSLLCRDDGCIGHQGEVNPWVGHQVGLELSQVHVQGSIEAERCSDGRNYLADETVQVDVARTLDVKVSPADIVDSLIVDHEGAVSMLQGGVGGEDGVVRLHHSCGDLRGRVDGKLQLGLLPIVHRETFHQQRGKAGSGASTKGSEDKEALETRALVSELADPVHNLVHEFLTHGVVPTGIVIGSIFLARDELLRMPQSTVRSRADLVHHTRLEIDADASWHVLSRASLTEEGVEGVITTSKCLVTGHESICQDPVLQAVEFPAGIAHLAASLPNMDRNHLTHGFHLAVIERR